jgi:uncharacterized protein (UPF0332 family)
LQREDADGTWHFFRERFVTTGRFDRALFDATHAVKPRREAADYDAERGTAEQAEEVVLLAERFVQAVGGLLGE